MRRTLLVGAGALVTVAGVIWMLQGLGYIGGSVMTGSTVWAVIGPLVALLGLLIIAAGIRARSR
jgi:hypothetical protein